MRIREAADSSFEASLDRVLAQKRAGRFSKSTIEQTQAVLAKLFKFLRARGINDIHAVREKDLFAYARSLTERTPPLSAWSQRAYLSRIIAFFATLDRQGALLQNPALDLPQPKASKTSRKILSEPQAAAMMEHPSPWTPQGKRDRAVLELLYGTGLRLSECAKLELRDVDLSKGSVFVRAGKGLKDRIVPISGRARDAVDLYLREGRPGLVKNPRQQALFLRASGAPIASSTIQHAIREAARAAQVSFDATAHTLRHTYATHLLKNGASIVHVQKLLGHSNISTTAIYTRVLPADLAAVMKKAHPRERTYNRPRKRTL